jgi:hypothetical protein
LRDQKDTVDEILGNLSNLDTDAREFYLRALLTVAGLRGLEEVIEEEARKMPLLNDILENRVLGREFKRGELSLLRRLIEERFGPIPRWAEDRLVERSAAELEELGVLDSAVDWARNRVRGGAISCEPVLVILE